jgi:hypothetical protein
LHREFPLSKVFPFRGFQFLLKMAKFGIDTKKIMKQNFKKSENKEVLA